MATYVDFSPEEEQLLSLAAVVNASRNNIRAKEQKKPDNTFLGDCAKLVEQKETANLLDKLLKEAHLLFGDISEKGGCLC